MALFALGLDGKVSSTVETALCRIFGGHCGETTAAAPERCLTGQSTTSANANVFVAFADAFQEAVQAAGGFDGILRDLASYNDEIPLVGWDNPLGGIDDWALDQLGIDDDGDLPTPTETYVEGKAFLKGEGGAGAGIGVVDGDLKGLIEGAGVVKVTSSGENQGDARHLADVAGGRAEGRQQGARGGLAVR